MKKLLLTVLLTLISTSAMAEWKFIEMSDDFDVYADIASKRKSGKKVKIWTLYDYKSPQKDSSERLFLSAVIQQEFDCFNETTTMLSFAQYTENTQSGSVVQSYTLQPAETITKPILPNSIGEGAFKKACGKK